MKRNLTHGLIVIIEEYRQHLIESKGLTPGTIRGHTRQVRQFLQTVYGKGAVKLDRLRAPVLNQYISDLASRYKPKTLTNTTSSLRSFFKFAEMTGRCQTPLSKAVPTTGFRSAAQVPKFLTEEQLATFLASFRSDGSADLRNRAMALCLVRLGLRASEVVNLKLEDLDWRQGIIHLTAAKGRRHQILPLELDLRQSLVDYLSKARPKTKLRHVFLSLHAAGRPLRPNAVSAMTARALKRTGIAAPSQGAHLFRHTVASHLVQRGATIKEIADFLRHRSLDTAVLYAKVNFPLLQAAVQPWPEVKP